MTKQLSVKKLILTLGLTSTLGSAVLVGSLVYLKNNMQHHHGQIELGYTAENANMEIKDDLIYFLLREMSILGAQAPEDLQELPNINSTELLKKLDFSNRYFTENNLSADQISSSQNLFNHVLQLDQQVLSISQRMFAMNQTRSEKILELDQLRSSTINTIDEIKGKADFQQKRIQKRLARASTDLTADDVQANSQFRRNLTAYLSGRESFISEASESIKVSFLTLTSSAMQIHSIENESDLLNLRENIIKPEIKRLTPLIDSLKAEVANTDLEAATLTLDQDIQQFLQLCFAEQNSLIALQENMIAMNSNQDKLLHDLISQMPALASSIDQIGATMSQVREGVAEKSATSIQNTYGLVTFIALAAITGIIILCFICYRILCKALTSANSSLRGIAHGDRDLTKRMPTSNLEELNRFSVDFNIFIEKIQTTLLAVQGSLHNLQETVEENQNVSKISESSASNQMADVESASTAIEEMTATIGNVAQNAVDAAQEANETTYKAESSLSIVNNSKQAIEDLLKSITASTDNMVQLKVASDEMKTVLNVIGDIAEQTNLLALNAAIEAARAGEQGRGFAVVADEVRGLASRTQESTQEISKMIARLQDAAGVTEEMMLSGVAQANSTMELVEQTQDAFNLIVKAVHNITVYNEQIASATGQQQISTQNIAEMVTSIKSSAQDTSEASSSLSSSSQILTLVTDDLNQLLHQFKL